MSLLSWIGPARDAVAESEDELRTARVQAARANTHWTELPEPVRRGLGLMVDAESDECYVVRRGETFIGGRIGFNELVPLSFYVSRAGDVVMLERAGKTWSDVVRRRAGQRRAQ